MPQAELKTDKFDRQQETARVAALNSLGILDTPPEPGYDAITRLAAEYFRADTALLGFADESRIWIKSHWGEDVRELPRSKSIFNMVLADDGPDCSGHLTTPSVRGWPDDNQTTRRGLFCQRSGALF